VPAAAAGDLTTPTLDHSLTIEKREQAAAAMKKLNLVLLLLAALPAACTTGHRQGENALADAGRAIIEERCSACHTVQGAPPGRPDAPSMRSIARRYPPESLAESLAEGIMVGHPDMPEVRMDAAEISAVIAFLKGE
jgi:mono/diheme cytochrome c family protein